jgi:dipeptidyl aminopeptidase/acylaminoacyl peptidase
MRRPLLLIVLLPLQLWAQQTPFLAFKKYPFTTALTASATGERIAWAMNEEGRRNVYVAEGPAFTPRKLTAFTTDDGQEITSLGISADGQWVVFVRGGDHGANWDDDLPVNPAGGIEPFKVQVAIIPFSGGVVKFVSEGDGPAISPDSKTLAFIKGGQAYTAPLDTAAVAKLAFTSRGSTSSLKWSPDGKRLLFVSGRGDHAIIGFYTPGLSTIKWIAPSFGRDESPQWSGDGSRVVFVRRWGRGGEPDSMLVNKPLPWSIYMADTMSGRATRLWTSPNTLRGSFPSSDGGANLHWADGNTIVFLSYEDGWPHLYSLDATAPDKSFLLLTPGNFMCEHISLTADKRHVLFSANTGDDAQDIERRHIGMVSVNAPDMRVMTPGKGLEWMAVGTGDGKALAFISATAQRPPLPTVMSFEGNAAYIIVLAADEIPVDFPQASLVTPRQVVFKAEDGVIIHADLFEPPTGAAGANAGVSARRPAIVYVHGGPPRQMLLGWHYSDYYSNAYASNQYLASLGFVVLSVNYRLGIGYGYDFHQPPHAGTQGAAEYKDIKAAGRWLRRQAFVDSNRIGIYGGSYGGFLTAMALAHDSKIFKAGVDFHGVHDWTAQARLVNAFEGKYEKAPDYDKAMATAWRSSPVSAINTWKSPVLIIQGDDDRNVSFNQSVDLVNRLEKKGVPYETMVIVDDTHHWMKFANAVTVYSAAADFFVRQFMTRTGDAASGGRSVQYNP